jgi:hypothetical protein
VTTAKRPESEHSASRLTFSEGADDWIRQFIKVFEQFVLDAMRDLPPDASVFEAQVATGRAILKTYLDSGMEFESALELFGQVVIEKRSEGVAWDDVMNQRRFELVDKEIQGSLTSAERIELAGLTRSMRKHVESEANLPIQGAQTLHRKLLQLKPLGEPE